MSGVMEPEQETKILNGNPQPAISSRWLHKNLGVKRQHTDWFRDRVNKYDFREGVDFMVVTCTASQNCDAVKPQQKGLISGKNKIEYWMTLTMAKEFCMLQNNDIGKEWRRYFIRIEEEHRESRVSQALRDMIVLEIPKPWKKFIPDELVYEIARLWGLLGAKPGKTPSCFGWFYNKVLYAPLWNQLPDELKREREKSGISSTKLHQFLAEHPRKLVEAQMLRAIGMMSICEDMDQFMEKFDSRHELQEQFMLPFKKGVK